jgi:hypothetical protein
MPITKQVLASMPKLATNFAKAVAKHVVDGMKKVDIDVYVERLAVCNKNECGMRVKNRCTHESCGCFLDKKAWWASEDCPMGLWRGVYTSNPTIEE